MSEKLKKEVAIIFGTYNRFYLLTQAINSIKKAVGSLSYYIIAVDGGSTDGSREWLTAQKDVVLLGQRGELTGAVRAFNLGFSYAVEEGTPFICHLNDDAEIVTNRGIEIAVNRMKKSPKIGEIAFAFDLSGEYNFDYVNGKPYGNFGVIRREAGMAVARHQGDPSGKLWWNPIYKTYGADSEFGVHLWKLGWTVETAGDIKVHDANAIDELRTKNGGQDPERTDSKIFWEKWRNEKFQNLPKIPVGFIEPKINIKDKKEKFLPDKNIPDTIQQNIVTATTVSNKVILPVTKPAIIGTQQVTTLPLKYKTILITGGKGFLGKHITNQLVTEIPGQKTIISLGKADGDLTNKALTQELIKKHNPEVVIHLAAKCGGIGANSKDPVGFFTDNMLIGMNVLNACKENNTQKLLFVGTTCSYPKFAKTPLSEDSLWVGLPEQTNSPYGLAKRMLIELGESYKKQYGLNVLNLIPANLYGPNDNFDLESSHVIPAIIRKMIEAKDNNLTHLSLWGTGTPTREFLYVRDAAIAIINFALFKEFDTLTNSTINIGSSVDPKEISIRDLATKIAIITGYRGEIIWDNSHPDGQPKRALNVSRMIENGIQCNTLLDVGLKNTVDWYIGSLPKSELKK